jgi:hypothetical protein
MNLMPHRQLLCMSPLLDYAGLAYGAAEMIVVSSNCAYLFAVELWFVVFDGCGEFADTNVHRQNRHISSLQSCLLLNGDVHIPFSVFSVFMKQLAFSQLMVQEGFLFVGKLDWCPDTFWMEWDTNPPVKN